MNITEFFAHNSQVNKNKLAHLLDVSSGVVTRMDKHGVSTVQALALDALDSQLAKTNQIDLDITEWCDKTYGNTYFSGWMHFKGENYFLPMQYGYGSHCEDMALKLLEEKGLIPSGLRQYELMQRFNINVKVSRCEVLKRDMFNGEER